MFGLSTELITKGKLAKVKRFECLVQEHKKENSDFQLTVIKSTCVIVGF